MIEKPEITQIASQLMAYIPISIPRSEIQKVMGPGIQELMAAVAEQRVGPTGPWFTHHLKITPETFELEICVPVKSPVAPVGRVKAGELPAGLVARTIFQGGYENLGAAWGEFMTWIAAQGHTGAPDLVERYLKGPESGADAADYRTELIRPLLG